MAVLNSSVYTNGVSNVFLDSSKMFAVCLLDASNNVLATSAPIKYSDSAIDGYITNVISWDNTNKQLKFNALDFTKTKSTVSLETLATQFGILEVNTVSSSKSEAYSTAGTEYYWPVSFGSTLVSGALSSAINVNVNNSFRFDSITVSFSEADGL